MPCKYPFHSLKISSSPSPPEEATRKIRMFAALGLYQAGEVSAGAVSELAGLDRYEFLEFCKREGVVLRIQMPEELEKDVRKFNAGK